MSTPFVNKTITKEGKHVRIVSYGDPFNFASDLVVEIYKNEKWEIFAGFNTLSDDYAYTNANESIQRAFAYGFK